MKMSKLLFIPAALIILFITGCVTEKSRTVEATHTQAATRSYSGPRSTIIVGNFDNRSDFMRGIFTEGDDRLGSQAKTILMAHLNDTNRFMVLDRDNMDAAAREAQLRGQQQQTIGARFIVTGAITEFGRRETGRSNLFGLLGSSRQQMAYTRVTLNVVDSHTSAIVYSVQGAGEVELSNSQFIGFGTAAGYDTILNGKVLELAIREAVDRMAEGIDSGAIRMSMNN